MSDQFRFENQGADMQRMALKDLPVGELFVRQDSYGDGSYLYIKLSNHSYDNDDFSACKCGTPSGDRPHLIAGMLVQPIKTTDMMRAVFEAFSTSTPVRR